MTDADPIRAYYDHVNARRLAVAGPLHAVDAQLRHGRPHSTDRAVEGGMGWIGWRGGIGGMGGTGGWAGQAGWAGWAGWKRWVGRPHWVARALRGTMLCAKNAVNTRSGRA